MKLFSTVLLLFAFSFYFFGQSNPSEKIFLERLVRQNQAEGQIIYTDKISKDDMSGIKSRLKKNIFYDSNTTINQNSIALTRQEKKYILEQLELQSNIIWQENLFQGSKLIKEEEALSFIKKTNQEYLENYNNPNNTEVDRMTMVKSYQRPNVFKFSKPIYFRDNSLCLIFFSSVCGTPCGFDELSFYKIENDTWTKWVVVNTNQY